MLIFFSSICLTGHSLATPKLIQYVVLFNGQALLDAIRDQPTHAGLDNSVLYAAGSTRPEDYMCAFSPETGHVSCSHAEFRLFRTHAGLAVHAAKETVKLLQKASYT